MTKYELNDVDPTGGNVKKTDENGNVSFIPRDPGNTDYQEYLLSLDESKEL
jgi:hypothetical protein